MNYGYILVDAKIYFRRFYNFIEANFYKIKLGQIQIYLNTPITETLICT